MPPFRPKLSRTCFKNSFRLSSHVYPAAPAKVEIAGSHAGSPPSVEGLVQRLRVDRYAIPSAGVAAGKRTVKIEKLVKRTARPGNLFGIKAEPKGRITASACGPTRSQAVASAKLRQRKSPLFKRFQMLAIHNGNPAASGLGRGMVWGPLAVAGRGDGAGRFSHQPAGKGGATVSAENASDATTSRRAARARSDCKFARVRPRRAAGRVGNGGEDGFVSASRTLFRGKGAWKFVQGVKLPVQTRSSGAFHGTAGVVCGLPGGAQAPMRRGPKRSFGGQLGPRGRARQGWSATLSGFGRAEFFARTRKHRAQLDRGAEFGIGDGSMWDRC